MDKLTFADLAHAYLTIGLKGRPTQREYTDLYYRYFDNAHWGQRPLEDITRFQIMRLNQTFMQRLDEKGQPKPAPDTANKVVGFVKRVFTWGMDTINAETDRPYWEGADPAYRLERQECLGRERLMNHAEIKILLQTIDFLSPKYQAFFLCRLLVPCRIKELCNMRRDAVSSSGVWTKRQTKNGRDQTIYIATQAQYLLRDLPLEGEYFFMGHYHRPLTGGAVRKMWGRWRAELGLQDLWLLDFRRTIATYLYRVLKADELTVKAVLNHYDGRPVAVYVRLDYDYLADILQGYADWIYQFKQEVYHDTNNPILNMSIASVCSGVPVRESDAASGRPDHIWL